MIINIISIHIRGIYSSFFSVMKNNEHIVSWIDNILYRGVSQRRKSLAAILGHPFLEQQLGTHPLSTPSIKDFNAEKSEILLQDIVAHTKNC